MLRKSKKLDDESQDFLFPPFFLLLQTRVYPKTLACESKLSGKAYGYDSLPVVEVTFRRVCDGWFPRVGILRARAIPGINLFFSSKLMKSKKHMVPYLTELALNWQGI